MKTLLTIVCAATALTLALPRQAGAQNDTLQVPEPPPAPAIPQVPQVPQVAPVPPVPGVPAPGDTLRKIRTEHTAIIERLNGGQRIVVVKGDTTIIITQDHRGDNITVTKRKDGQGSETDSAVVMARRAMLHMGHNSREGGYLKVETSEGANGDKEPVTIETKRKVYRIYTDKRKGKTDSLGITGRLKELRVERRNQFTYWSGLDLGVNTLLGPDNDADLSGDAEFMQIDNGRSRFFSINFMERKFEFGSHHVGLLTGLGWEFTNYHLKNNVLLAYNADSVYGIPVEAPEFRKNKLRQMGVRVPLMLEFNTKRAPLPTREDLAAGKKSGFNRKGNFHLAAGVVGSWYFDTMYKQKYRLEGEDRKDRDKGDYLLLPYRAAASVRVGYGALNLFAEYALTPLFREGKGPELTPFNVGLTIVGFN